MLKKILYAILAIVVVLQFFRPALNNTATAESAASIGKAFAVPPEVHQLLRTSCYDCHSNNTQYPWYASIQPTGWWLQNHIEEGKKELNFDEFSNYQPKKQYHKLEEIGEVVKEGEMPLSSYTLIHRNAVLNAEQKKQLFDWTAQLQAALKAKYPEAALIEKD